MEQEETGLSECGEAYFMAVEALKAIRSFPNVLSKRLTVLVAEERETKSSPRRTSPSFRQMEAILSFLPVLGMNTTIMAT